MQIPSQKIITKDNVSIDIAAVAYYHISDPEKAVIVIENVYNAINQTAFTRCFGEGGFFDRIDYSREPEVPLDQDEWAWLDAQLIDKHIRKPMPPHTEIALAAYHIWDEEGRPHGRDREHWRRALEQLRRR